MEKVGIFSESSQHDQDAMLRLIGTLVKENQLLKSENYKLKRQFGDCWERNGSTRVLPTVDRGNQGMKHDCGKDSTKRTDETSRASSNVWKQESEGQYVCKYFLRGFCRNGRNCNFKHKAPKLQYSFQEEGSQKCRVKRTSKNKIWKICSFCSLRHQFGSRYCSAYGKLCSICLKRNHSDKACFYQIVMNESKTDRNQQTTNEAVLEDNMINSEDNDDKETQIAHEGNEEKKNRAKDGNRDEKKNELLQLQSCPVTEGTKEKSNGSESITLNWVNEMLGQSYSFLPKLFRIQRRQSLKELVGITGRA